MQNQKNGAGTLLPISVIDGITVNILPSEQYEFLLSTADVALGYGVSPYAVRKHKMIYSNELIESKHFLSGVTIRHGASPGASKSTMWTKSGVIRLGFFIRSERAKLFRDWAENLILKVSESAKPGLAKILPAKRKHNRLTADRLVRLLTLSNRINDAELRNAIVNELTLGGQ